MSFQMICRYVSKKTNGSGYRHCKSFLTYANMWRPYRSNANQAHLKRALIWPPCHKHTLQRCFALVSPTDSQTLFQCSSCDKYTTNAMNCCNCFFPRVHHGEIHINWNVFNPNRKLQYLATILEHLHTRLWPRLHWGGEMPRRHTLHKWVVCMNIVAIVGSCIVSKHLKKWAATTANKKQPNVVHHRWQPVHNPKLKKFNKVSFRIARIPCA